MGSRDIRECVANEEMIMDTCRDIIGVADHFCMGWGLRRQRRLKGLIVMAVHRSVYVNTKELFNEIGLKQRNINFV